MIPKGFWVIPFAIVVGYLGWLGIEWLVAHYNAWFYLLVFHPVGWMIWILVKSYRLHRRQVAKEIKLVGGKG